MGGRTKCWKDSDFQNADIIGHEGKEDHKKTENNQPFTHANIVLNCSNWLLEK